MSDQNIRFGIDASDMATGADVVKRALASIGAKLTDLNQTITTISNNDD